MDEWTCVSCHEILDLHYIQTDTAWYDPKIRLTIMGDEYPADFYPDASYTKAEELMGAMCLCCDSMNCQKDYFYGTNDDFSYSGAELVGYLAKNKIDNEDIYRTTSTGLDCKSCMYWGTYTCIPLRNVVQWHIENGALPTNDIFFCREFALDERWVKEHSVDRLELVKTIRERQVYTDEQ